MRLIVDIRVGDWVIVPRRTGREVYLAKVTAGYQYRSRNRDSGDARGERGFQHYRPVRWLLSRQALPIDELPKTMRAEMQRNRRLTIAEIKGDYSNWLRLVDDDASDLRTGDWSEPLHRSQDADDDFTSLEGEQRLAVRRERLREARFRQAKIDAVKKLGQKIRCEVPGCYFNFEAVYGAIGDDFIHVHHRRRLADFTGVRKLDDLMLVCPNCHAMIHSGGGSRDPDTLIQRPRHA